MHFLDGLQEFSLGSAFEHVACGAGCKGVENILGVLVNSEHHYLDVGGELFQLPHTLHSVHPRKVNVHQHHVGILGRQCLQCVLRAGVLSQKSKSIRAAEDASQSATQLIIVLDDGDTYRHEFSQEIRMGAVRRTTAPPSSVGPMEN